MKSFNAKDVQRISSRLCVRNVKVYKELGSSLSRSETHRKEVNGCLPVVFLLSVSVPLPAMADSISPSITDGGKVYSTEKRDSAYFGTGSTGRLSEASYLRFMGDQQMSDGNVDEAIKSLAKAVQLDTPDPVGHVMLARAMTRKLKSNKGEINWELYGQCLDEWRLIAKHDADHQEQFEARMNLGALKKMAKEQVKKTRAHQKRTFLAGLNPLNRFR